MQRLFIISCLFASAMAFGRGPPWKMCSLLIPKHRGIQQQTSDPPYTIDLPAFSYSPGTQVQVTLRKKTASAPAFKGFVLGAHQLNGDTEDVVGQFVSLPNTTKGMSWYADAENRPNCVSHNSKAEKEVVVLTWEPPTRPVGDVIFVAAVVQKFSVFWANISSAPLRAVSRVPLPAFPSALQPGLKAISFKDSCGVTKGCLLYPKHCSPDSCEMAVAFKRVGASGVEFEMFGTSSGYMALSLSTDRMMGKDSTMTCTAGATNSQVSFQHGYNPSRNNERHRVEGFTMIQVARLGNKIYCRFRRPIDMAVTTVAVNRANVGRYSNVTFSLRRSWIAFLTPGDLYRGTNVLAKHSLQPVISRGEVDFLSTKIFYASALPKMVHLHATFMLLAWMLFAGFGMILAGNFKETLSKMVCGAGIWFQLHRSVMIGTFLLTGVGLTLIFVHQKGWDTRGFTHGAVGLSVVALMVIQILCGLTRPGLDHPRRKLFNWVHFLLGNGVHILAAVTMTLAFLMPHLPPTLRFYNLIVVICWICFQVFWTLVFRVIRCCWQKRNEPSTTASFSNDKGVETQVEMINQNQSNPTLIVALIMYIITSLILFSLTVTFVTIF